LIRGNCSFCRECEKNCPTGAITVYGRTVTVDEILPELIEDRDFYESSGGGVTLSGGECLLQADFCEALLIKLKEHGIHIAVDTCGFVSREALDKVIPYTDLFLYDIKAISEDVHIKCTGQSNKIILENLKYIDECGHPLKDEFSERVYENAYHLYTSGTNDEAFMEFSIDEFTPEQRDLVRNIDLFEVAISEGIDDFINEIYEE
jgi:organic radical activating enzyme